MMEKKSIQIVKKGQDNSNLNYWISKTHIERLIALEEIRTEFNKWKYGVKSGFQRVYKIVKREKS